MRTMGSFGVTRLGTGPEFYLHPPFRNRNFLFSLIALLALCVFSGMIVLKGWSHLSVFTITWITISMCWASMLFRLMLNTHGRLKMLLAAAQVNAVDKESPLGDVLGVITDVSARALFFSYWSLLASLIAIAYILSGR